MSAAPMPRDHLPASLSDAACVRRDEATETMKALYRDANAVAGAIRAATERQARGALSRAEGAVLTIAVRANLRACVRREAHYRPTREGIAKETGYSVRTVSRALARFKELGLVEVARYGKGGRAGDRGHGLATEFRSGGLGELVERLTSLGYRIGSRIAAKIKAAAAWAADRIKPREIAEPTGTQCPGTLGVTHRTAPGSEGDGLAGRRQDDVALPRGRLGALARAAFAALRPPVSGDGSGMVPMPAIERTRGGRGGSVPLALPKIRGAAS